MTRSSHRLVSSLAVLASVVAPFALAFAAGCKSPECKPEDKPKDCPCQGASNGLSYCVEGRWSQCDCRNAQAASSTGPTHVVGAGAVPGGKEVTSDFCRNNCKGQANTCKATGVGEPGTCEKELTDCLSKCPN
jgi:hypothetical protein